MSQTRTTPKILTIGSTAAVLLNANHRNAGNRNADWVMACLLAADAVDEDGDPRTAADLRWVGRVLGGCGMQPYTPSPSGGTYWWYLGEWRENDSYRNYVPLLDVLSDDDIIRFNWLCFASASLTSPARAVAALLTWMAGLPAKARAELLAVKAVAR